MNTVGKYQKNRRRFFIMAIAIFSILNFSVVNFSIAADEAPDVLVKRVSQAVLDTAKTDKDIQSGNRKKVNDLVESKIFPYVDFERTTSLTAGRNWSKASPDQQKKLADEFRRLLVSTYAGAIANIRNQQVKFKPFRSSPTDTDVVVHSEVVQPNRESIELDYRLEKTASGWKIYDMNILGAWLIETYKPTFSSEINKSGIDGLIKVLTEKNDRLAHAPTVGKKEEEKPE